MAQDTSQEPQNDANTTTEAASPVAWYARPWFWSIFILLILLLFLAWLFWKQWQIYKDLQDAQNAKVQEQLAYNASLEEQLRLLREALANDPCTIKEFLLTDGANLLLHGEKIPAQKPIAPNVQDPSKPSVAEPFAPNAQEKSTPSKAEALPPPPLNKLNETPMDEAAPKSATPEATPPPALDPKENKENQQELNNNNNSKAAATPVAHKLEQATVLIAALSKGEVNTGSGFFIAPGIILTNAHVASTKNSEVYVVGKFSGIVTQARVLAVSNNERRDYAVLQVPVKSVEPLKFTTKVARTQKISAWGFPGAVTENDPHFKALLGGKGTSAPPEVVYSEGSVSVIQDQNPPLIFHTAVLSHGNSGGPLVDEKGDIVGINTYIAMDNESYRQSSLAIVSKDIVAFLKEHNIPFSLAE